MPKKFLMGRGSHERVENMPVAWKQFRWKTIYFYFDNKPMLYYQIIYINIHLYTEKTRIYRKINAQTLKKKERKQIQKKPPFRAYLQVDCISHWALYTSNILKLILKIHTHLFSFGLIFLLSIQKKWRRRQYGKS